MSESSQTPAARRFTRPNLRTATLILPKTGERVKKSFTLRRASTDSNGSTQHLLGSGRISPDRHREIGRVERYTRECKARAQEFYNFATSRTGQNILKCSIAYVLASLATFVAPISGLLGRNDGKHMVATIAVYFHPARSAGNMAEAIIIAFGAFIYAAVVSFTSMAVSVFFGRQDLLIVGHIVVLVLFCGGGLGLVGWTKQKLGNPLVNVGCSLTSLALITVLTKEGAVQAAMFSYNKVWQVLKMVIMGTIASAAVCLLIRPTSARHEFRDNFIKATDVMGEMLTIITRSFLSGSEHEIKDQKFVKASNQSKTIFKSLVKNLGEGKYEHYVLGTEQEYKIEARLVKCLEKLMQSIGGLRSSAETQFTLLAQVQGDDDGPGIDVPLSKSSSAFFSDYSGVSSSRSPSLHQVERRSSILASIDEVPESSAEPSDDDESGRLAKSLRLPHGMQTDLTSVDMFSIFIAHLGPPMKSLAYTLREVLDELPFGPRPTYLIAINEHFRSSLLEANALFANARKEALGAVYKNKIPTQAGSVEVAADFEEVAASCGYFSSSLQDFAEDTVTFLDILEELKEKRYGRKRTWSWLKFWQRWTRANKQNDTVESSSPEGDAERSIARQIHNYVSRSATSRPDRDEQYQSYSHRVWRHLRFFRRDDVKYACKVGIGAIIYAMWSFIPETREQYGHWRGEWGLLSYMLVCSMTIGASNTTGFQRFFGTCIGAIYAVIAWILADENPFLLAFFGWLVSLQCFYIIVGKGKGPMGRFIFLTYNLSALYAYSLSVKDEEDDEDEGGISPEIWEIVLHRVVAVMTGCLWGIIITRVIWPISARRRVKKGTSLLWLKMGLIWRRGPLRCLLETTTPPASFMSPNEELELRRFLSYLDGLRNSAKHEFELRGPFPDQSFKRILDATSRMLDGFHAMNVVVLKDLKASEGEKEILKYTSKELTELGSRTSHLFSVLASSMKLAYPMNDVLPKIDHTRDRLLAKVFEFRRTGLGKNVATDEDYELLYAYALVTGQMAQDLAIIAQEIEQLYGVLSEEDLKLE